MSETTPAAPDSRQGDPQGSSMVCIVDARIIAKTTQLLGSLPLPHPASKTRDGLIEHLRTLKPVEVTAKLTRALS